MLGWIAFRFVPFTAVPAVFRAGLVGVDTSAGVEMDVSAVSEGGASPAFDEESSEAASEGVSTTSCTTFGGLAGFAGVTTTSASGFGVLVAGGRSEVSSSTVEGLVFAFDGFARGFFVRVEKETLGRMISGGADDLVEGGGES